MGVVLSIDELYWTLCGLRDGGLAGAEAKNEILSLSFFEFHSRAIVGSKKLGLVVDLRCFLYKDPRFFPLLDSLLREVNAIQALLNDWLQGGGRRLVYSIWKSFQPRFRFPSLREEPSEASIPSYAVLVSAVVLLSLVYQYLTGNVDIRSSKAYSRSSLDFRDIYVAVVLFLGAYVWIKFREVLPKGVHERKRKDKQGRIKVVGYEPRFKPPRENGTVLQWIYLGQYATPEEAAILYQIAAFYYNEGEGGSLDLEDGRCFSIPPMPVEERSLTGAAKRAWVKVQAMKVYEDFKMEKAEAALLQALLEACEDPAMPSQVVDLSEASLLNSAEHQVPLVDSPAENSGMATARLGVQGFECAPQSFGGVHEGFVTSSGHSLGYEEESAIPTSQLTPDTQSGMGINNSNQLNLLQLLVHNQQELITYQRQQLQELRAQNSVLQNQQCIQEQQLEESRMHISQLESQHFVHQQLQVLNQGVSGFEVEMQQSLPQQNHPCRPHGSAF